MKLIRMIVFSIVSVLAFANVSAKTVSWSISPNYDKISRYSSDIFVFQQNGKWGFIKLGNKELSPAIFDYITPFINGYALAGTKEGSRYQLNCVVAELGELVSLNEKYYLPSTNNYFSEGKLVVINKNGKYGYINESGNIVVKCQFDNALPFKDGWAPVKQGNYFKYITDNYDRNPSKNILVVDFHYGEMTMASCFTNGKAVIAYNKDFALIGINGKKIKKLNESDFKAVYKTNNGTSSNGSKFGESSSLSEVSQNGLVGLKCGDDIIVQPQFESFSTKYDDNLIITTKGGKQGLLSISDGDFNIGLGSASGSISELMVDRNDIVEDIRINFDIPVNPRNLKLLIDCGNGDMQDFSSHLNQSETKANLSFKPIVPNNAEECNTRIVIENDGIIVAEANKTFSLSYPIKLRLSSPKATSVKADENDNVTIYANIYNDSNKAVTVTATLKAKQSVSHSYTIQPHGSVRISITEKITNSQIINSSVSLSTGERVNSTLSLEPYW